MQVKNIRHIGIVTDSIVKSLEFYCSVLGFVKATPVKESGQALSMLLGFENCIVTTCKISTPDGGTKLELLQFERPKSDDRKDILLNSLNLTHFAITVESADEVFSNIKKRNLPYVSEPVKTDGGPKVFFIKDVNNVFIEIVEE